MKTIWLDTDIGSDIDDALALAYLLARDDCDLIGISTVTEFDNQRAKLASALCRIARKQIPIHPGLSFPLLAKPRQTSVPQAIALEKWAHDSDFVENSAVDAMRTAIRARPGEITLLAIGPMTNLGVLFALDPEIPSLLKELVLMCGVFAQPEATEWNAKNDAHAAGLTYRATVAKHLSIGLDVTRQVMLEREEFEPLISTTEIGRCALDMAAAWFKQTPIVTFHDPLAAAVIFEPTLCGYERGQVDVELEQGDLEGQTKWAPNTQGVHEVALTVDSPRFFSDFFGVLNRKSNQ
jgi:purine nucleosidase